MGFSLEENSQLLLSTFFKDAYHICADFMDGYQSNTLGGIGEVFSGRSGVAG